MRPPIATAGVVTRTGGLALAAITHLWLARELGPAGYGSFVLALVVNGAAVLVANVGVGSSVAFWTAAAPTRSRETLLAGVLAGTGSAVAAAALLVPLVAVARFDPFPGVDPAWMAVAVAGVPLRIWQESFAGATVGLGRSTRSLSLAVATPGLFLVALVSARADGPLGASVVAAAWLASQVGSLAVAIGLALPALPEGSVDPGAALRHVRSVFVVGCQQTLTTAAWWLLVRTDRSLVGAIAGADAAGRFAVASSLADLVLGIPSVIAIVAFYGLSRHERDVVIPAVQRMTRGALVVVGSALMLGLPATALLSRWLLGPSYADVVWILAALSPGILAMALVTLTAPYFFASLGRPALNFASTAAALIVLVPAVWALASNWGVVGAAAGTSAAYVTAGAVSLALFSAKSDTPWRHTIIPTAKDGRVFLRILAGADPFAE